MGNGAVWDGWNLTNEKKWKMSGVTSAAMPLNDKWGRKLSSHNLITGDSCKTGEEIETKKLEDEVGATADKEGAGLSKGD